MEAVWLCDGAKGLVMLYEPHRGRPRAPQRREVDLDGGRAVRREVELDPVRVRIYIAQDATRKELFLGTPSTQNRHTKQVF